MAEDDRDIEGLKDAGDDTPVKASVLDDKISAMENQQTPSNEKDEKKSLVKQLTEKEILEAEEARRLASNLSFFIFNFVLAPIMLFAMCVLLGGILAIVEGWRLIDGFYFIACDITGTGPFFVPHGKLTLTGEVFEILISVISLTVGSAIIGLAALMSLSSNMPDQLGIVDSPLRGLVVIFILIPIGVIIFCFVLGALFAAGEGWSVRSGFEYLIQTVCGLGDPLTNASPESDHAKILSLIIAIGALGITSVIVGLVGAMAICETSVAYIEVKLGIANYALVKRFKCLRCECLPSLSCKKNNQVNPEP